MERNRIEMTDERLTTPGQLAVRAVVHSISDEEPSMAWRSELNEKLRQVEATQRRRRSLINWTLKPAIGLGFAGILAVVVLWTPGRTVAPSQKTNFEGILVNEHRRSADIAQLSAIDSFAIDGVNEATDGPPVGDLDREGI